MSIYVILLDQSPIVEKMLSHCLYYYSNKIQRIENWDEKKQEVQTHKPNIFFVDWELKIGQKPLALSLTQEMKPIPVVTIYRSSLESEIKNLPAESLSHTLVKPFDPKKLRKLFTDLVPQVSNSKIHPFLKFSKKLPPAINSDTSNNTFSSSSHSIKNHSVQEKDYENPFPIQTKPLDTQFLNDSSIIKIDHLKISDEKTEETKALHKTENKMSSQNRQIHSIKPSQTPQENKTTARDNVILNNQRTEETKALHKIENKMSSQNKQTHSNHPSESQWEKKFNIDETTQNELAPMAIKSSAHNVENHLKNENIQLSERDILRVLNKYKDTLEFEKLIEKKLNEYIETALTNFLKTGHLQHKIPKSLNASTKAPSFHSFVEQEVKKHLNQKLPLIIKNTVEKEIKKIVED